MTARQPNCISTAAMDNNSTSGFRMSSAELVKDVSHPVKNILVSRAAVNALSFIISDKEEIANVYFIKPFLLLFKMFRQHPASLTVSKVKTLTDFGERSYSRSFYEFL